jgi:hypothetical protein
LPFFDVGIIKRGARLPLMPSCRSATASRQLWLGCAPVVA